MYDEWLAEEKATKAAQKEALHAQQVQNAQVVASLAFGDTETPQSATIRAVTPDTSEPEHTGRGTTSFEHAFVPVSTTTITGGRAAQTTKANSPTSSLSTRLRRDREWNSGDRSPGSRTSAANGRGMLGRSSTQGNGESSHAGQSGRDAYSSNRPRTRTLDERRSRDRSPTSFRHRHRIASVNTTGAPLHSGGADYLASVPAATSPPSAPSISSLGSPVQIPTEIQSRRSVSPVSSHTV